MINETEKAFDPVPWERYNARYNQHRYYWKNLQEQNLFLTKEQIVEPYGDPSFLFKSQLEWYYRDILADEFRFRNITLFTEL